MSWQVLEGDALEVLRTLESASVQTCVTSPPYWGLRDYGNEGQLGLESTPEEYVANLVEVFREVKRVLRDDGTVWLNLGDSHATHAGTGGYRKYGSHDGGVGRAARSGIRVAAQGLKEKDLVGIPWAVAFALRADGWWLRSDIIWAKPNPMPESVTDRPTRSHEYIFLLSKSARYFYDADAIRESFTDLRMGDPGPSKAGNPDRNDGGIANNGAGWNRGAELGGRNRRSVWTVTTQPYPDAHFATFPPKLVEPCILAGSPPECCGECGAPWERVVESGHQADGLTWKQRKASGEGPRRGMVNRERGSRTGPNTFATPLSNTLGWTPTCKHGFTIRGSVHDGSIGTPTVLDPFCGSGTTGLVALRHNRSFIGIELNPTYAEMARNRIRDDAPLLNGEEAYSRAQPIADKQRANRDGS
jgi:DNA modification methylase